MIIAGILMNKLVTAIGWMLIHSLWQGGILALLVSLCLHLTRGRTSFIQYRILLYSLFIFIISCVLTCFLYWDVQKTPLSDEITQILPSLTIPASINATDSFITRYLNNLTNTAAPWLVFTWFLFVCYRIVTYTGGWLSAQQLKQQELYSVPENWKHRLELLTKEMGLKKKVRFLESALIKVPVTMGILKPVILLPVGILCSLPAAQIEMVLRHELAHIRRNDYLVNIVQLVTEALFFFNPALMWISAQLRDKREYCCDDIALKYTNDSEDFARALVLFKTFTLQKTSPLVALSREPGQLQKRVLRILGEKIKTSGKVNTQTILCSLFAIIFLTVVSFKNQFYSENETAVNRQITIKDTLPQQADTVLPVFFTNDTHKPAVLKKPALKKNYDTATPSVIEMDSVLLAKLTGEFNTVYQDNHYIIGVASSRITYLKVNGEVIIPEEWPQYQQAFAGIVAEFKAHKQKSYPVSSGENNKTSDPQPLHTGSG